MEDKKFTEVGRSVFNVDWKNIDISLTQIDPNQFLRMYLEGLDIDKDQIPFLEDNIKGMVRIINNANKNPSIGHYALYSAILQIEGPKPKPLIPGIELGQCMVCEKRFRVGDYTVRVPIGYVRIGEDCDKLAIRRIEVHLVCWKQR